jgi:hypothetical protein
VKRLSDQTLYEIIEVAVEAAPEEIARACDRAAATYGPGSLVTYTLASAEESALLSSRIEEARAVLLDASARSRYDERIGVRAAAAASTPSPAAPPAHTPAPLPAHTPAPLPAHTPAPLPAHTPAPLPAHTPAPLPAHTPAPEPRPEAAVAAPAPAPAPWPAPQAEPVPAEPLHVSPGLPVVAAPIPELPAASEMARAGSSESPSAPPVASVAPTLTAAAAPPAGTAGTEQELLPGLAAPVPIQLTVPVTPPVVLERPLTPILLDKEVAPPRPLAVPEGAAWSGEMLRRVRESRGLTLPLLAERTRITRHHLENIEQDRFKALPAPVYLRGIIMSMARELRLDGQKVARSYLERMGAGGEPEPKK